MRTRVQIEQDYNQATRNISPALRAAIERDPRPSVSDNGHIQHLKGLYRELTPYLAGNGHWEAGEFHQHA